MEFQYKTADITKEAFGRTSKGEAVDIFYLQNRKGMRAEVLNMGGILHRLIVDDRNRIRQDIVLGSDKIEMYEKAAFAVQAGLPAVSPAVYDAQEEDKCLVLRRVLLDEEAAVLGREELRFAVTEENELMIGREIVADKELIPDSVQPIFFNLAGQVPGNILDHAIALDADRYVRDTDSAILSVENTPLDFREGRTFMTDIFSEKCQIMEKGGFLHTLLLENGVPGLNSAGTVYCERSGIYMDFAQTDSAVTLSTFNCKKGQVIPGKRHIQYEMYSGFCLLPGRYPNTTLRPGENWTETIRYQFTIDR